MAAASRRILALSDAPNPKTPFAALTAGLDCGKAGHFFLFANTILRILSNMGLAADTHYRGYRHMSDTEELLGPK